MRRQILRWSALLTVLVMVAVACGDDDDDTDAGGTTTSAAGPGETSGGGSETTAGSSGAPVRGVSDTEIRIGGVASLTSPTGPLFGPVEIGASARFERANQEGGVQGRTIDFLGVADDGADPARTQDLAREQVLQDEVFAIVPALSPTLLQPTSDFLTENAVPFAGWAITPAYCGTPFAIGFNGCLESGEHVDNSLCGTLAEALDLGEGTTVVYQGEDSESSRTGAQQNLQCWEDVGATIVYDENNIPVTEVIDYSPFVQAIMSSDDGEPPDVVLLLTGFGSAAGMAGSLKAAGYEGAILNFISYLPGALAQLPDLAEAFDGVYVNVQWLAEEFDGPAIEAVQADLAAIGEPDHTFDIGTAAGYWSADVFLQVLDAVGPDLTPEAVTETLQAGFTYTPEQDPPGLGPLTFPAAYSEPSGCSSLVRHDGTEYEPILPLTCYPVTAQR